MALDRLADYTSMTAACHDLAPKLNIGVETLRKWVVQAQIDAGVQAGPSTVELEESKKLKSENRDLREANEILKAASIFFAGELDPRRPTVVSGLEATRPIGTNHQ